MDYGFECFRYRRPFRLPPRGDDAVWRVREGILLRLVAPDGRRAYGEVAPLPAFGSESVGRAEQYLNGFEGQIRGDQVLVVPEKFPCCRFALESALTDLESDREREEALEAASPRRLPVAGLVPGGRDPRERVNVLLNEGYRTLKWKIGVRPYEKERDWFRRIREVVPPEVRWRLDANGALDVATVERWDRELEGVAVEYLEQPLPVGQTDSLLALARDLALPFALDEEVGTVPSLIEWRDRGWKGIFVVKPAIAGSPVALKEFIREESRRVVFSSALETGIGMRHALAIALAHGNEKSAVGWGTGALFDDDGLSPCLGASVSDSTVAGIDPHAVWNKLAHEPWGTAD